MDYNIKDKRFAHVARDARFRKMPVGERKVKIDRRFKGMFNDKRFKLKYSVDKRGKPMHFTTNENLKKYYEQSDEEESDNDFDSRVASDSEDSDAGVQKIQIKKSKQKTKAKVKSVDKRISISELDSDTAERNREVQDESAGRRTSSDRKINFDKSKKSKKDSHGNEKGSGTSLKKEEEVSEQSDDKVEGDSDGVLSDEDDDLSDVNSSDNDDVELHKNVGNDSGVDFARGEGNVVSSSSSEDDDDTDDDDDDDDQTNDAKFDHGWGEKDSNIIELDEATYRLAVCNMDWDRVKAKDIFVLLNSFKPSSGIIKSVKVYPSEYGKERMAEESTQGPRELKEMTIDEDEVTETVEGTSYHREKLREYQLNRLKYFYAVVECDSAQTADAIYKDCDGLEYESSATKLDLRFIPDEETFDESDVKSVCTGIPINYKPQFFKTAALTQTKVELTWDETDHERVNLTNQQFTGKDEEIADEDLKAYLASSSDEEGPDYNALLGADVDDVDDDDDDGSESDEDKKINKYKQLLTEIESEEKKKVGDIEMEISWEPGLREATESLVKKKKQEKSKTVWEDYLERKKEKKRQKMEERKKKREMRMKQTDSVVNEDNVQDNEEREHATFSDDDIPVDADMAAFMAEELESQNKKKNKNKKKKKKKRENEETPESSKEKAELSLLMMDEEENKKHFNLKDLVQDDGKQKKKKKKDKKGQKKIPAEQEESFKMNVDDPRFSAVFDSHLYNIDPSAPEYRKTKGTEAIISEKIKRSSHKDKLKRKNIASIEQVEKKQKVSENLPKADESLASLIKSVKSKTALFHGNKSKR